MIRNIFIYFILLNCIFSYAQKSTITGVILDELNNPIENVNIICNDRGTVTDSNGFYKIEIESNSNKKVAFTHINFKKVIIALLFNSSLFFLLMLQEHETFPHQNDPLDHTYLKIY